MFYVTALAKRPLCETSEFDPRPNVMLIRNLSFRLLFVCFYYIDLYIIERGTHGISS